MQYDLPISETLICQKIISHKSLSISSSETCIHFLWPTMKHTTKNKNKRRSRARKRAASKENDQEQKVIRTLTEAFSSVSVDDVVSAYREANCHPDKAAEFLSQSFSDIMDDPTASSMSSGDSVSGSGSGSSEGFVETICVENMVNEKACRGRKHKKVVAATGTVSTIIGKEYVRSSPKKDSRVLGKFNVHRKGVEAETSEQTEQFLYSMLGKESELSLTVVRDVLCQCGFDVEKALDVLLDSSSSTQWKFKNDSHDSLDHKEESVNPIKHFDTVTDGSSDCIFHSSECELQNSIWSVGCTCRNYARVLANSQVNSPPRQTTHSDLSHKVLESLFKISKMPEYESSSMNLRNVVKKLQLMVPHLDDSPSSNTEQKQEVYAKADEYTVFRQNAKEHWNSMRSYYQKAATAYAKGSREYASYLSEQGKRQTKLAQNADERASKDIFKARNRSIENVITIDLHGQHVKQAMRLLKMHLLFAAYAQTVQLLRIITGCGSHGGGKSKLKQSVINLLEKEGIVWSEENRGALLVKLAEQKEFSFLDSLSDTEDVL